MDTTKAITHVSLCAGYGGIDLGLKRAIPSLRTIAFSEIEGFACANLVAKMEAGLLDPAPIWTDLKTFPWAEFHGCVDICSFGYPCQPFSAAGKRLGAEDPRHLWPFIADGIAAMRPSVCFAENVEGHISLGLPDVLQDLAGLGYRATWCVASASEVGAPHQRKRVFILAQCVEQGLEGCASQQDHAGWLQREAGRSSDSVWPSRPGEQQFWWEPPRVVADSKKSGRTDQRVAGELEPKTGSEGGPGHQSTPASADCGDAGAISDTQSMRLEEQSECLAEREEDGIRASNAGQVRSCEAQEGRLVEHATHWSNGEQPAEQQGRHSIGGSSEEEAMDDAERISGRTSGRSGAQGGTTAPTKYAGKRAAETDRQTQPSLGRDADGPADWLDAPELFVTCDNRTDELRLLGNGVVPATAERAFRILVSELMEYANP